MKYVAIIFLAFVGLMELALRLCVAVILIATIIGIIVLIEKDSAEILFNVQCWDLIKEI